MMTCATKSGINDRNKASRCNYVSEMYCKCYNISRTFDDKKDVHHSDVAGASPVGDPPTTSSFST